MFRLIDKPLFWRTVTVRVPSETVADAIDEISFRVQFEALHDSEARAMDVAFAALPPDEQSEQRWRVLRRVVRDWGDVVGPDGRPVPFSPAALEQALGWPWVGPALIDEWRRALAGEEARLGN